MWEGVEDTTLGKVFSSCCDGDGVVKHRMECNQICQHMVIYLGLCGFRTQIFCLAHLKNQD